LQEIEAPRFRDIRHTKVVRLSALRTGRLYPPENIPGTHFCWRLSRPQVHSAAGKIMSLKNSIDTIWNRAHDLLACGALPQPTTPPCSPILLLLSFLISAGRTFVIFLLKRFPLQRPVYCLSEWSTIAELCLAAVVRLCMAI